MSLMSWWIVGAMADAVRRRTSAVRLALTMTMTMTMTMTGSRPARRATVAADTAGRGAA